MKAATAITGPGSSPAMPAGSTARGRGRYWDAPRLAYAVTAAVAGRDHAGAEAMLDGLGSGMLAGVVACLGGHARHAAWTAEMMRGAAAGSPARQMMAVHHLSQPPASDLAAAAISDEFQPPGPEARPALREAALCLAAVIISTLAAAGWPRDYVAADRRSVATELATRLIPPQRS